MNERGDADRLQGYLPDILRQIPAGVLIAEAPSGRILHGSERFERIWRRPLRRLASLEEYGEWRGFHPDGRPYLVEEWPLVRALIDGEVVEGEEIEILRGDDTRGVIRVNAGPIRDSEGRVVAAVSTFFDITERRRQEEARHLLTEASALLSSSLDYAVTLRNVARLAVPTLAHWCAVDILAEDGSVERLAVEHHDPAQAELTRELERSYSPDPHSRLGVARVLRTGTAELYPQVDPQALKHVAHDEEHLRILRQLGLASAMVVPLLARGKTLGALVFVLGPGERHYGPEDLTLARELAGRAALAIDNARLYHESQAANRAKADFLAVISHELRTPLTAIIGYSELLGLGVPDPVSERQKEQVERIEVAARHLLQLIEEILTMANLESGQARVRTEPVPVRELLRRATVITEPMARAKGLALHARAEGDDLTAETDPDKLLQILLNLLSNAVKFTDQGEIHLLARRSGEELVLQVKDTGIGLEERYRSRIFDPFWQVEQPITRRAGGTGLGLAITRRLLDLLGGEIEVESTPGQGSTFTARIPLCRPGRR